jgi:hypothetical protein
MAKDEALQEALVALEGGHIDRAYGYIQDLLEQPEQEPMAWICQEYRAAFMGDLQWFDEVEFMQPPNDPERFRNIVPLYTSPPQRQPLSDEEIVEALIPVKATGDGYFLRIARAIEAAHGIGKKT